MMIIATINGISHNADELPVPASDTGAASTGVSTGAAEVSPDEVEPTAGVVTAAEAGALPDFSPITK